MAGKSIAGLREHFFEISQMTSFEERKEAIDNLMEEYQGFFMEYYSDYYNANIKNSDVTSEHNGVSKTLEVLASFLIYADNEENPCDKSCFDAQLLK